jgi:hypothetical protein
MRYRSILQLFLCLSGTLPAQEQDTHEHKLCFSPGLSWQGAPFAELDLMWARSIIETGGNAFFGPRAGVEMNFSPDHFICAPRIGYELSGMLISLRANTLVYLDGAVADWRVLPEAGLSLFGAIDLTYGYAIPLLPDRVPGINGHRISLIFNIDRELWKAL